MPTGVPLASWDPAVAAIAAGAVVLAVTVAAVAGARRRRRLRRAEASRHRFGFAFEHVVTPEVAEALERRTLRRGRLRLADEPGGGHADAAPRRERGQEGN